MGKTTVAAWLVYACPGNWRNESLNWINKRDWLRFEESCAKDILWVESRCPLKMPILLWLEGETPPSRRLPEPGGRPKLVLRALSPGSF